MLVQFVRDYQGKATGPHFYRAGQAVDLPDATAQTVVSEGAAVPVEPAPEAEPERESDKRGKRK